MHHSASFAGQRSYIPTSDRYMRASSPRRTNSGDFDITLRDIKSRYEDEARAVQQNYEADYHNYASLAKRCHELEAMLEEERRRSIEFENRYNEERRIRAAVEQENAVLKEDLRRAEAVIADYETKMARLEQEVAHLDHENKAMRAEIARLTDLYNSKLRDLEDKYMNQIRELKAENERLRHSLEAMRADYENRLREIDREWGAKCARLEEMLRDKERVIAEMEAEMRKMSEHVARIKAEYDAELRRQVTIVREEEYRKYQSTLKALEDKIHQLEEERAHLIRKNQELSAALSQKERQIQEMRAHFEAELARLKEENARLHRELDRIKEVHAEEMRRMVAEFKNEQKRWEDIERQLRARIAELENVIRGLEAEIAKLRTDLDRLRQSVTGNVHRTISETFGDYEVRSSTLRY